MTGDVLDLGCSFGLPGRTQIVARAEITALAHTLNKVTEGARIEFITDHLPLCKVFDQGPAAGQRSVNEDWYRQIFQD